MVAVEGAILIEAGSAPFFDEMWTVTLPKQKAIDRILVRNPELTLKEVNDRLDRQTTDEVRLRHSTFSYTTDGVEFETNKAKIMSELKSLETKYKINL